jgi:hypothetical protein
MDVSRRLPFAAVAAAVAALAAAGLVVGATLVSPPLAALPLLAVACIGAPMASAFELARAVAACREPHRRLRRELDRLPETPHPLGF